MEREAVHVEGKEKSTAAAAATATEEPELPDPEQFEFIDQQHFLIFDRPG